MRRFALLLTALLALPVRADEVQVAVASNFAAPAKELAARFERETGHRLAIAVGATGRFYAQIRNGAPFEVLLAADDETPARLEREGLAVPGTRRTYALGRLALWSAAPGVADGPAVLRAGRFAHLAIANPKLAPYGAAAVETLTALGLLAAVRPKFVQAENIAQAHQFTASGNAQLGFVALSQVWQAGKITSGSAWIVPAALHRPLRQDAVLLAKGRAKPAALAWLRFLAGDAARAVIARYGYGP